MIGVLIEPEAAQVRGLAGEGLRLIFPRPAFRHSAIARIARGYKLRASDREAGVAKLADAPDLGSGTARCAGSSPVPGTPFSHETSALHSRMTRGLADAASGAGFPSGLARGGGALRRRIIAHAAETEMAGG